MSEVSEQELIQASVSDVSPSEVVKFTQRLRYKMVDDLTNNGEVVRGDSKELLSVLKDMDASALTQRKLNIEEGNQQDGRVAIEAFRKLQTMLRADPIDIPQTRRRLPTDGVALPEVSLVPGEDHQGEQSLNIDDYVSPET